jgi:hypothetical protein
VSPQLVTRRIVSQHRFSALLWAFSIVLWAVPRRVEAQTTSSVPSPCAAHVTGDYTVSQGFTYLQQSRTAPLASNSESTPLALDFWVSGCLKIDVSPTLGKWVEKQGSQRQSSFGDTTASASYTLTNLTFLPFHPSVTAAYLVKVPTSSAAVSPNRQLEHTVTAQFQGTIISRKNKELAKVQAYLKQPAKSADVPVLIVGLEPGIDILGQNSGGSTLRAVLNLSASYTPDYKSLSGITHWSIDSRTGCFGPSQSTASSCSETLSVSHKWPAPNLKLQMGSRIGLTPYDPRFGVVGSLAWSGSLWRGRGAKR